MIELYYLIVNYNSSNLVKSLLESIKNYSQDNYRVIIVNNSPEDRNILDLQSKTIEIIQPQKNLGFGRACNLGLNWICDRNGQAIVWLINPDAYFDLENTISPTSFAIAFFKHHPQISILGTTVYNSDGKLTTAGGTFTPGTATLTIVDSLPEDLNSEYFKTDWVSGCSLLINLANFTSFPQFDTRYFLYYEDLDFCLRYSQQGHQIAVTHLLKVMHDTSAITNRNILQKYRHISQSYLIHIEKYGNTKVFILTNIRMSLNTLRLLILKPQQGLGKLIGIYEYWKKRILSGT